MTNENNDLEEECEDAVFQICCTRERYSVRCANQLEKYLALTTKKQTAHVRTEPTPRFEKPITTEQQEQLFHNIQFPSENPVQEASSKNNARLILYRLKELKSILNQIERNRSNEMNQLLE